MSNWIPITEALPPHNNYVLVAIAARKPSIAYAVTMAFYDDGWFDAEFANIETAYRGLATHWQPLPEPPDV